MTEVIIDPSVKVPRMEHAKLQSSTGTTYHNSVFHITGRYVGPFPGPPRINWSRSREPDLEGTWKEIPGAHGVTYEGTADDVDHYVRIEFEPATRDGVYGVITCADVGPLMIEPQLEADMLRMQLADYATFLVTADSNLDKPPTTKYDLVLNSQNITLVSEDSGEMKATYNYTPELSISVFKTDIILRVNPKLAYRIRALTPNERDLIVLLVRFWQRDATTPSKDGKGCCMIS